MSSAPLNPFASQTVSSLRKIEPPIRWLNDAALRKLIVVFELVEEKPHRCELVQLVLSRGDGYGKSHLLGRLVQELDGRATCVSVAPYHDPQTCWVTLLQSMLNELSQPELIHHLPYPPTPLDELAHQLFGFLAVMLADKGMTDSPIPGGLRDDILAGAFEKWDLSDPGSPLGVWVNETLSACEQDAAREAILVRLLKAATLHAYSDDASAMNWLLVLHRYAGDRTDEDSRQMCLEWILTNQLEIPAESFLQNDEQLAGNNLIARQQTLDLLALAKLYRPFLLCFDHTHSLTSTLARSFGNMLLDLVRDEGAHFSIVTANSNHWESTVLPEFSPDCLPCLATKMELAGLTREQGRSLAEQRLQSHNVPVELQERFLRKDWLQEQFAQGLLGQRDFLRRCQARYQELVPEAISPPDDAETPESEARHPEPPLDRDLPAIPTPDTHEPAPDSSVEGKTAVPDTFPLLPDLAPLPVTHLADVEPVKTDSILEAIPESASVSDQLSTPPVAESLLPTEIIDTVSVSTSIPVDTSLTEQEIEKTTPQVPTSPVIESPAPAEIIDTVNVSTAIPVDASLTEQEIEKTIPQVTTPPVIESPAPAEIIDTVSVSTAVPVDTSLEEQNTGTAISEPSSTIDQVSTPEPVIEKTPVTEQTNPEATSIAPEPSVPTASLPNNFSAFTPLVDLPRNQAEERKESELSSVLLPPAQEEFLCEPIVTSDISDAEYPATAIQELAKKLAEPEKTVTEEIPEAVAIPVIEAGLSPAAPVDLAVAESPSAALQETPSEKEGEAIGPQAFPESTPGTICELSADSSGIIPDAPLLEQAESTMSPAPLVTDAPPINLTPEASAVLPVEFEPKISETAIKTTEVSETTPSTEALEPIDSSVRAVANEPEAALVEISTPVADEPSPAVSETAPVVAINDQAELREALLQIIKAHRFASHIAIADELRRKMQRSVSAEEAVLCARTISEIHVYADGPNAAFLWQGLD